MWKFKPFTQKEQIGLEGRFIDIGNFKIQVRNVVAVGGFSSVYLARDVVHGSKQYALKHIICNDEESQELVMKEISVMKILKGHPNIVTLHADAIFDMGRTKEALLLMECCEKSLVNVLESRGAGFFEEKQAVIIFQDVCNAVFAMHCQNPPIAHRDLKAENILLGHDGSWKLCDFGSTSTNHKRFEKPEEMGIEEDNIRKYTTPAYRAPEMWDLFRREVINEKVDIWALGCLFYRICYLKLAFDGESKLQVLNGNYRIPDLPKYNKLLTELIRDMLRSSPDDRPDITQVWFRVNDLLPESMQKSVPDRPPEMSEPKAGIPKPSNKSSPMPGRSPPPVPSSNVHHVLLSPSNNPGPAENAGPLGAFWTSHHAKDSEARAEKNRPKYSGDDHKIPANEIISPDRRPVAQVTPHDQKSAIGRSINRPTDLSHKDLDLFPDDQNSSTEGIKQSKPEMRPTFQNDAFNDFVAEFDVNKKSPNNGHQRTEKEKTVEAEVEKLKKQLANVSAEKADITSKYEKLAAICRSQRQEIQDLKHAVAARTPSPSRDSFRNLSSPGSQSSPTPSAFFQGASPNSDSNQWQAFSEDPKPPTSTLQQTNIAPRSVRTKSSPVNNQASPPTPVSSSWGFETESFKVATPAASSKIITPICELNNSKRFDVSKSSTESKFETKPAGWAGF